MAHLLRALVTLPEDLSSIPTTHIAARNYLKLQFQGAWHHHTEINTGNTPMHVILKK